MQNDLELAASALSGDLDALRAVDRLISDLPVSDEARQRVRTRALVEGRLSTYLGTGPLRLWLKTMAVRLEVDLQRDVRLEDTVEDRVLDRLVPPSTHAEAELVGREARAVLKEALGVALRALPERERLFVQHYHLDGLTLTAIAALYRVAPSTVMRALDRTLEQLRGAMRAHLLAQHQLGLASLDSLVRAGVR